MFNQTEPFAHEVKWVNEKLQKTDEAVEEECKDVKACSMKEVFEAMDNWSFCIDWFKESIDKTKPQTFWIVGWHFFQGWGSEDKTGAGQSIWQEWDQDG